MGTESNVSHSYHLGQDANWDSPLLDVYLHVELPFYIFVPPGPLTVEFQNQKFDLYLCPPYKETYVGDIRDSRLSRLHLGPNTGKQHDWSEEEREFIAENGGRVLDRYCKTVVRINGKCHEYFLAPPPEGSLPRTWVEQETYRASLAEAHLPVLNELVQRYRLTTYDYFAYELSPWDVPVWTITSAKMGGWLAHLVPYAKFDLPPVITEMDGSNPRAVRYADLSQIEQVSSAQASAGEFELLDARSAMERGDYTGAIRRTVTALEAVVQNALYVELRKLHDETESLRRLERTNNDFPGRLRQWAKLSGKPISAQEQAIINGARLWRHDIVHRGARVGFSESGRAQYYVDTMRWFYNKVEDNPEKARLRDYDVRKSFGRRALSARFPTSIENGAFVVQEPQGSRD